LPCRRETELDVDAGGLEILPGLGSLAEVDVRGFGEIGVDDSRTVEQEDR
jgi:hypothetical protein